MFHIEADEPGYRFVAHTSTVIAVWRRAPTIDAVERMDRFLASVASQVGGPVYVMVVIGAIDLPDGATRRALAESMAKTAPLTRHIVAVIQGQGLRAAAMRAVASSVQLLAKKTSPTTVLDKPSAAVDWLMSQQGSTDSSHRDGLERALHFAITGERAP